MALHPKDRAELERFVGELRALHGEALLCVALTGEAASADYEPRRSPLTTLVLLAEVTPEALRLTRDPLARGALGRRRLRRVATPLMLDPPYVESSLDVFPLEFLDLKQRHEVLEGRGELLRDLTIDRAHLRLEVEEQLRGKMLHLWEAYLEAGRSTRTLRRLLLETPESFAVILRGMLWLRRPETGDADGAAPAAPDLLAACERALSLELPTLRRLEAVRRGGAGLARAELEPTFAAYLDEVRRLVRAVDTL